MVQINPITPELVQEFLMPEKVQVWIKSLYPSYIFRMLRPDSCVLGRYLRTTLREDITYAGGEVFFDVGKRRMSLWGPKWADDYETDLIGYPEVTVQKALTSLEKYLVSENQQK